MVPKTRGNLYYYLLLGFTGLRMLWLTLMEPWGAATALKLHPNIHTWVGRATLTLPFVVYTSIAVLTVILIGILLKKYWAYFAALIFATVHLILISFLVILRGNPRLDGPIVVITACVGMIVFSFLTVKEAKSRSDSLV